MLLHGSVSTAQITAADALIPYVSQSMRERLLGVIFFMVFIVSTEQKVADFVFVSVKLNQDKNTSVVITERLNECKGVREIVCGPICSSVFHCVFVCLCSMWVLGWMSLCVFETFSLFLWINMCFCMVCSPVQHV